MTRPVSTYTRPQYDIKIDVTDGRIEVRAPFRFKDALKAIPGRKWNKTKKAWTYDETPHSADAILSALGPDHLNASNRFWELVRQAELERKTQGIQEAELDELAPIPLTKFEPWLHQLRGYHWVMSRTASMLYMGMGTGKTKIVIDAAVNMPASKVLVLAPLSVVPNWSNNPDTRPPGQFAQHAAAPFHVEILGRKAGSVKKKKQKAEAALKRHDRVAVVLNYQSAWRDPFASWALSIDWDMVVLDESHKIKAPNGKQSKFCAKLGKVAKKRIAMTGTPMPHSPLDVFAQFRFLDPGLFGRYVTAFRSRYSVMGGFENRQIVAWKNQEELNDKFYRLAYHTPQSVLDLPPETTEVRRFELGKEEAKVYAELDKQLVADVQGGVVTATNALTRLLRLAQVTGGFVRDEDGRDHQVGTSKASELKDLLEDMGVGSKDQEPVVVFCRFHWDLDMVHKVTEELGSTSGELSGRDDDLADWQQGGPEAPTVLAVQVQSGEAGIDLTRTRYVCYYSLGYSLGDYDQSKYRVLRPGQEHPVTYVHLVAEGTVDDDILVALSERRDLVEYVLEELRKR